MPKTGDLGAWQPADGSVSTLPKLTLPEARSGASFVAGGDGIIIVGGRNASGPTTTVWKSSVTVASKGALTAWQAQAPLVAFGDHPRADATAILSGNTLYVYGGVDAKGPTAEVLSGNVTNATVTDVSKVDRWGVAINSGANLPAPRTDVAGFTANGALYVVGGTDGTKPQSEVWWTTPDATGAITGWKHLSQSDLPAGGLAGGSAVASGSFVYVIGGAGSEGVTNAADPGQPGAETAVLPARRPVRPDRAGAQDRRRDRPADRLPQRGRGRHARLRAPDPHRLGHGPQGEDARDLRAGPPPEALGARVPGSARHGRPMAAGIAAVGGRACRGRWRPCVWSPACGRRRVVAGERPPGVDRHLPRPRTSAGDVPSR